MNGKVMPFVGIIANELEILIKDYKIAAIPGEPFGMEKDCYLRVSYGALNTGVSEIGTQRLIKGLRETIG